MRIHSRSPGKLILSGEHAVVHGCPALAMAVSSSVEVVSEALEAPLLCIHLSDRPPVDFDLQDLPDVLEQVVQRHHRFQNGDLPVSEVLDSPEQLLAATAALTNQTSGAHLRIHSQIPLGSGLGSSAACILALLKALQPHWQNSHLFEHAVRAESFQHGHSSGLDVAASLYGGLIHVHDSRFDSCALDSHMPPFRVFNSGRPESSTGECVSAVSDTFPTTNPVWSDFREVTEGMLSCLKTGHLAVWHDCIAENHRLLCRIGVVPPVVQNHIASLEQSGCAAKICGAGSLRGERAGMILVCGDTPPQVPSEWQEMHFTLSKQGTTLLSETA